MTQYKKDRPLSLQSDEYGEYYARYIGHVIHSDLIAQLKGNQKSANELFGSLDNEQALYRYEVDKWFVKEVMGHEIHHQSVLKERYQLSDS